MSMSDFGSARRASHTPRHLAPPDEIMHDALREVSEDDLPKYLLGEACETAGTITDPELKDQALIRLAEGYAKQAEYPTATRLAHSTNDELAEVEALARIAKASGFVTHMDEAYESAKNIPVKSQQIEALAILGENGYEPGYAKARKTLKRHLIFRKLFAAQDTTPQEVAELYYSIGNHGDEVSLIAANEIVKDLEPAVKGELALSMAAKGHRILLDKLLTVNPASITRHPHSPELLRTCAVMYEAEGSTHKARILLRILEPHQEQRSSVMRQVLGILVEGRNEESS